MWFVVDDGGRVLRRKKAKYGPKKLCPGSSNYPLSRARCCSRHSLVRVGVGDRVEGVD